MTSDFPPIDTEVSGLPPEVVERALLGARIGVWELELESGVVRTSEGLAHITGFKPSEIIPHISFWSTRIHPDDIARVEWERAAHLNGASDIYQAEYRVRCKNGEWLWIQSLGQVNVRDMHGKPLRIAGVHTDIHQRKAAETALDRERNLFRDGPVIVFRWQNKEGWPVEKVSPNVYRLFGHSAEDFLTGRVPYAKTIHPDDLARVAQEVSDHLNAGVRRFEQGYRIIHKSGEVRWLYDYTVVIRDDDGEVTHFEGYVLDDSERQATEIERKELERRVFLAQKLEGLGVLAGGIAHDFNNLLVGIMGNIELAKQLSPKDSPAQRHLTDSLKASTRAAELIHSMLVYAGRANQSLVPVDLNANLLGMRRLLLSGLSKGVHVDLTLDDEVPTILGDAAQLSQVFMNLLINASEAIEERDGIVKISTSLMSLNRDAAAGLNCFDGRLLVPGEYAVIEITDTGCGMDHEVRQSLFDPFYTTKFTGRGLGLSSVLGILRSHNGTIEVESSLGKGSTFRIFLPTFTAQAEEQSLPMDRSSTTAPGSNVLVIDDEQSVRLFTQAALSQAGHSVHVIDGGANAIEYLRTCPDPKRPDSILLDMTMSGMSGRETLLAIRELYPDMPVVLSSGYSQEEVFDQFKSAERENVLFLAKPYAVSELVATLTMSLCVTR